MLLDLGRSTHHIRRCGAGDIHLLFVMQLDAGDRHFVTGAQQATGGGKAFPAAWTQVVDAQIDGTHPRQALAQLLFIDGVVPGERTADAY